MIRIMYSDDDRTEFNHPWARLGSKASKSVGSSRWLTRPNQALLPDVMSMQEFIIHAESDSNENSQPSRDTILRFAASHEWTAYIDKHKNRQDSDIKLRKEIDASFGGNKLNPADIIDIWDNNPYLYKMLLDDFAASKFVEYQLIDDKIQPVNRLGVHLDDLTFSSYASPMIEYVLVKEPTAMMVSIVTIYNEEAISSRMFKRFSRNGLSIVDFAEGTRMFEGIESIYVDTILKHLREELYSEPHEVKIPNAALSSGDGFARWIYEVYLRQSKNIDISDLEEIATKTLLQYAREGIFKPRVVKNCCHSGIDPALAGEMLRTSVDN